MAVTATPIYPQSFNVEPVTFVNSDGTTSKQLLTAQANGVKIFGIFVTNTDASAAYAVQLFSHPVSTDFLLGTINVPLSSGNTIAAPTINLLNTTSWVLPKDSNGNPFLYWPNGAIYVAPTTTVASGKTLTIIICYEKF